MKEKKPAAFRSILNPRPPVLVSCRGKDGKNNALAVVYACNCSYDPPGERSGPTGLPGLHRVHRDGLDP